jgi:hypothetical protein
MTTGFRKRHGILSPASVLSSQGPVSQHASVACVSDGGRYVRFGRCNHWPNANGETRAARRPAAAVTSGCQAVRCSGPLPIYRNELKRRLEEKGVFVNCAATAEMRDNRSAVWGGIRHVTSAILSNGRSISSICDGGMKPAML